MQLYEQLKAAGIGAFPCRENKNPATPEGVDWRDVATWPASSVHWPTDVIGVPVPAGVVVIDLDLYKGVTRESVEQVVGCPLPWDQALIQRTQNGGEHYAFQCSEKIRQGSNLLKLTGFDTRVGGLGYICTGKGYTTLNGFGVFRLADARSLPSLPAPCQSALGYAEPTPPTQTPATHPADLQTVVEALKHVDPGCSRSTWVKIGMALKSWVGDDPDRLGEGLFEQWSSGALASQDPPTNYVAEHVGWQWQSFKPEGDTRIGSLFYEAIQSGWKPPLSLDTSLAFGPGGAHASVFNGLVDAIQSRGGNPKQTAPLMAEITAANCNRLQHSTLLALLTRELKDAGLLTKPIRQQLDAAVGGAQSRARGEYGRNHTENATLFLERFYPYGGLVRSDQVWYGYNGKVWQKIEDDDVEGWVAADMSSSLPQSSTVTGTISILGKLVQRSSPRINETPKHLIVFQNGVLDLTTGQLGPHSPELFTTIILPYEHLPHSPADRWLTFLNEIFEGDQERINLLQEWFGYVISNNYDHHKILMMLGAPRSGKGTIGRILEQIVGPENYTGASLHAFTSEPFLDSLRTKTVAFSGDTERRVSKFKIDAVIETLKKISGNDAVTFSRKFKTTLSQQLPTRIVLAANHVPALFDDSGALAGRLLVLPFDVCFSGREDLMLFRNLLSELPGIAAWSLEGLRRLSTVGHFSQPEASQTETTFIEESFSPLVSFLRQQCVHGPEVHEVTFCDELYDAYRHWAVANTEAHIIARRPFIAAFKDATRGRGCKYNTVRKNNETRRGFTNLRLKPVESATEAAFKLKEVK